MTYITSTLLPNSTGMDWFLSSASEDFPDVDFLIAVLILKLPFVSGFLTAILHLAIGKMLCPMLQLSDVKFSMELYYHL